MRTKLQELVAAMLDADITLEMAKREFEAAFLMEALSRNGGCVSAAAKRLGLHRNTFSRKVGRNVDSISYHGVTSPEA